MGNKPLQTDIDKTTMAGYYSQLSSLYFYDKRQEVDLRNVLKLTDPPTNRRIKKLVQSGLLNNVHYNLNSKSKKLELVKNEELFRN